MLHLSRHLCPEQCRSNVPFQVKIKLPTPRKLKEITWVEWFKIWIK